MNNQSYFYEIGPNTYFSRLVVDSVVCLIGAWSSTFRTFVLIMSLVGYMFGGRKVAIASSFGLASYSALTMIGAIVLCYLTFFLASNYMEWFLPIVAMAVAIINIIISFKIIKELRVK